MTGRFADMRTVVMLGFIAAAAGFARELPKFEVDPSAWRQAMQKVQALGPRMRMVVAPPARCAIRLLEVEPLKEGKIRVVKPEEGRKFAMKEATVPAEACVQR